MYIVFDSLGNPLRRFPTYKAASTYKIAMQRYDWPIVEVLWNAISEYHEKRI